MNCIHTGASAVTLASRRRASSAAEGGRRALKAAGQKIIFCNSAAAGCDGVWLAIAWLYYAVPALIMFALRFPMVYVRYSSMRHRTAHPPPPAHPCACARHWLKDSTQRVDSFPCVARTMISASPKMNSQSTLAPVSGGMGTSTWSHFTTPASVTKNGGG
jgi:hypothetical protein